MASICTIARPDAIVDISTDRAGRQWWPTSRTLDLNPAGRPQTKFRPLLPTLPLLAEWLAATFAGAEAEESTRRTGHRLVNYYGRPVRDVDRTWGAMPAALDLPAEPEWCPYLLRHSVATLMRGAGVPKWELQGFMGHHAGGITETYAVEEQFPSVLAALQQLVDDLETRAPGALHRSRTGSTGLVIPLRGQK